MCHDVSQSHYEPVIHCSLIVPRLAVVRGSLVLGTGLGVSPSPWGLGHSWVASLGTHHWAWLHMSALHPAHSGASPRHSPHPHRWVHHAWMCRPIRHHGRVCGRGWHPELSRDGRGLLHHYHPLLLLLLLLSYPHLMLLLLNLVVPLLFHQSYLRGDHCPLSWVAHGNRSRGTAGHCTWRKREGRAHVQ